MIENNKHCAFCKSILFDDDEVVYCPICGAPHHADCYKSCGHCALEHLHGTDKQYDPHPEDKVEANDDIPRDRVGHTCPHCGKISSSDTLFCPYCGNMFGKSSNSFESDDNQTYFPGGFNGMPVGFNFDPLGGIDKSTKIGDCEAGELANFVRINTRRYIPLFARMEEHKKKVGWNWSAFLFPAAWNIYRKNYVVAIVLLALVVSSLCLISPMIFAFNSYIGSLPVGIAISRADIIAAFSSISGWVWLLFGIGIAVDITGRVISGLFGDAWYKKRVFEKVNEIKNDDEIEDTAAEIAERGGVNHWLALLFFYPSVMVLYQAAIIIFELLMSLMSGGIQ